MQVRDGGGDPTPVGLATGGAVTIVVAGGVAAAGNATDWVTPIITLIGAVFVATLTAVTTNRRQSTGLEAEDRRLSQQLNSENMRLSQQLAHDRDLQDLSAARALLDEAARSVGEAIGRGGSLRSAMITWGNKLGIEGGVDEFEAFRQAGQAVDLLGPRIKIMFGTGTSVSDAFGESLAAIQRVGDGAHMLSGSSEQIDSTPYVMDVEEGLPAARAAHERFLQAAHGAVGLR